MSNHRGEFITVQADNVAAAAWLDRKVVTIMCTGCDPTQHSTVLRSQKDGTRQSIPCPGACAYYNRYMGGVDRGDQLRGYYHVRTKCRKFYKYVANFLLDVAITNAYILYRIRHPRTKVNTKRFRDVLALEIIGNYSTRKRAGRGGNIIKSLPMQHFPTKATTPSGGRKRGRCVICAERKKRLDTQWRCVQCGVWLCHSGTAGDCFLAYHRRVL